MWTDASRCWLARISDYGHGKEGKRKTKKKNVCVANTSRLKKKLERRKEVWFWKRKVQQTRNKNKNKKHKRKHRSKNKNKSVINVNTTMKVGLNVLYALSLVGVSTSFADNLPLTEAQRTVYAQYMGLQMWVYSIAENRNETLPFGYRSIAHGHRWAIVKPTTETPMARDRFLRDRCLLIHRGTFNELEALDDLDSQFANTTTVNGVPLNTAFWNSYARYEPEQTSALHKAFADTSCRELDITGHSLGGATCMISLVHLSPTFPVVDVVQSLLQ